MIKAIIFDYGGVLVEDTIEKISEAVSKKFNKNLLETKQKIKEFLRDYQKSNLSQEKYFQLISNSLNIDSEELKKIWIKEDNKSKSDTAVENLIKRLRINGYKTALLSNTIPYGKYLKKHLKLFTVKVFSENKIRKPELAIYRLTLKKLEVNPEESIFVDNKEVNLIPARELGMQTILFQNPEQLKNDLQKILKM